MGGSRNADRQRADHRAGGVERAHRSFEARHRLESAPRKQVILGNAAIAEEELRGLRGAQAQLLFNAAYGKARRAFGDDKRANAGAAPLGVNGGEDHNQISPRAVGNKMLLAV